MYYVFDSIRSVWLRCQLHQKNWLLRITFLTVFAVCGLDANNTKKKLVIWYYTICKNYLDFWKTQRFICQLKLELPPYDLTILNDLTRSYRSCFYRMWVEISSFELPLYGVHGRKKFIFPTRDLLSTPDFESFILDN